VRRMDSDTMLRREDYEQTLAAFGKGEIDLLVGTQMIAKGLHFPSVTLVGVVLADVGLGVPDFRSGERTFQLLYQVAGRSGRGAAAGRVIVQTYQPGNYAIKAAAAQDYRLFYDQEIDHRREHRNPPFTRLARLSYSNVNGAKCELEVHRLHSLLSGEQASWGISDVEILGPTPAHPARLRGHYRWQLVLRGTDPRVLLDKVTIPHGWDVDIDPVGLG